MILVLGATGTVGGAVARRLIADGVRPRLLVRDVAKAGAFAGAAELTHGNLADLESLRESMAGVDHVFMLSGGADIVTFERNVVDAAREAGVRHVVKLSAIGADKPGFTLAHWHAESERYLRESGLAWTMIRPGNFATNALGWGETVRSHGAFYQPTGTGRWAAIDPDDIAAVAVKALTEPGHEGKEYFISGPESLDAAGYAEVLSRVTGREVRFVDVPAEAAQEGMLAAGLSSAYVEALLDLLAVTKAGQLDVTTSAVHDLLGRQPASFETWARANRAAFMPVS